jgi:hypothetical protein
MVETANTSLKVPSMIPDSCDDISSFPRTLQPTTSHRRKPSPPAPTIYLKGFSCIASDSEYQFARKVTGNVQPYWFEESYDNPDYFDDAHRRAAAKRLRRDEQIGDIHPEGSSTAKDKPATNDDKEREALLESLWLEVKAEHLATMGWTELPPGLEAWMKRDTMSAIEQEWDIMEEERIAEAEKQAQRLSLRSHKNGARKSHKKFKMKGKAKMKTAAGET